MIETYLLTYVSVGLGYFLACVVIDQVQPEGARDYFVIVVLLLVSMLLWPLALANDLKEARKW